MRLLIQSLFISFLALSPPCIAQVQLKHNGYLQRQKDFKSEWLTGKKNIGISSGASTPESTVQGVVDYLESNYNVLHKRVVEYNTEDVHFALPKELRA